jgi:hypothetical protein
MACSDLTHIIRFSNTTPQLNDVVDCISTVTNSGTTAEGFHIVFSQQGGSPFYTSPYQSLNPGDMRDIIGQFQCAAGGTAIICADLVCDTFTSQVNGYINTHPGQTMITYPWDPITNIRILPTMTLSAAPGNLLSIAACRGQYEPASFIIRTTKNISGINISTPTLTSAQGGTIPASEVNIKLVKVWYQASANDTWIPSSPAVFVPAPELLINDDSLVTVNWTNHTNNLKVTIGGVQQYINVSDPTVTSYPTVLEVYDAPTLQPFSMQASENKQIWVTVHVPSSATAGDYSGNIVLSAAGEPSVSVTLTVTVLPFDLEPSPLEYAIYYKGRFPSDPSMTMRPNGSWKTVEQVTRELVNMREHGIVYPTVCRWQGAINMETLYDLVRQAGFPTDKIYALGPECATGTAGVAQFTIEVNLTQTRIRAHGFQTLYVYGLEELSGSAWLGEIPYFDAAHSVGAKIFVACPTGTADVVGDYIDVAILAGSTIGAPSGLNPAEVAKWHAHGKKVLSYNNPQLGIENPAIYRMNYGLALWNAGYDGAMDYAYQDDGATFIYADWDAMSTHYRDCAMAYPTTNGLIDTIPWEGFRDGINDTRYVATLIKRMGGDATLAKSIVSTSLASNNSMATIRKKIIEQILVH